MQRIANILLLLLAAACRAESSPIYALLNVKTPFSYIEKGIYLEFEEETDRFRSSREERFDGLLAVKVPSIAAQTFSQGGVTPVHYYPNATSFPFRKNFIKRSFPPRSGSSESGNVGWTSYPTSNLRRFVYLHPADAQILSRPKPTALSFSQAGQAIVVATNSNGTTHRISSTPYHQLFDGYPPGYLPINTGADPAPPFTSLSNLENTVPKQSPPLEAFGVYGASFESTVPLIITWEMDESDRKDPIDLEQYLKCFETLPEQGASYQVKVYIDIPVNQSADVLLGTSQSTGEFGPGHVFMKLTKFFGNQQISQVIGFYPSQGLKCATMNAVPSKIVNDANSQGMQHEFNASITINGWTSDEFRRLLNEIRKNSQRDYELDDFNCANFVASSINVVKPGTLTSDPVLVYDPTNSLFNNTLVPFSPNGMYKALARQKQYGGAYAASIEIGVNMRAQASHGPCN